MRDDIIITKSSNVLRFPINQFPQRVGRQSLCSLEWRVWCFQSISFPSEQGVHIWLKELHQKHPFPINQFPQRVGSPDLPEAEYRFWFTRFQSISFPSEQGDKSNKGLCSPNLPTFPINQFPQRVGRTGIFTNHDIFKFVCFQSINFPNEQGVCPIPSLCLFSCFLRFPIN